MANYYNSEDVKNALIKQANECRARIELWSAVSRASKKDGSDFSIPNKNFNGADYKQDSYWVGRNKLNVHGWVGSVWVDDSLDVYIFVNDLPKDDPRREKDVNGAYVLTIDECFKRIEVYLDKLKAYLADTEEQIAKCDDVFKAFDEKMRQAWQELKTACGCEGRYQNSLYYAIRDYANNRYY